MFSPATREVILERDRFACVACGEPIWSWGWSIHHRANRGAGGSRRAVIDSPANGVVLCGDGTRGCHGHLTCDPQGIRDGRAVGLVVSKFADPREIPLKHASLGWVLLADDGTWKPSEQGEAA